jgi:hypothetical protein
MHDLRASLNVCLPQMSRARQQQRGGYMKKIALMTTRIATTVTYACTCTMMKFSKNLPTKQHKLMSQHTRTYAQVRKKHNKGDATNELMNDGGNQQMEEKNKGDHTLPHQPKGTRHTNAMDR